MLTIVFFNQSSSIWKKRKVWADKVASKYSNGGGTIKANLESNINNWFIKYDLK